MRLTAPDGYMPSGRSEAEIRASISEIPIMTLLSVTASPQLRAALQLRWWEEIVLEQKDRDEEEAYLINETRSTM